MVDRRAATASRFCVTNCHRAISVVPVMQALLCAPCVLHACEFACWMCCSRGLYDATRYSSPFTRPLGPPQRMSRAQVGVLLTVGSPGCSSIWTWADASALSELSCPHSRAAKKQVSCVHSKGRDVNKHGKHILDLSSKRKIR